MADVGLSLSTDKYLTNEKLLKYFKYAPASSMARGKPPNSFAISFPAFFSSGDREPKFFPDSIIKRSKEISSSKTLRAIGSKPGWGVRLVRIICGFASGSGKYGLISSCFSTLSKIIRHSENVFSLLLAISKINLCSDPGAIQLPFWEICIICGSISWSAWIQITPFE